MNKETIYKAAGGRTKWTKIELKAKNALILASMAFAKASKAIKNAINIARESCWTKKAITARLEAMDAAFAALDSDEKGDYEGVVNNAKIEKILALRARSYAEQAIYNAAKAAKGGDKMKKMEHAIAVTALGLKKVKAENEA